MKPAFSVIGLVIAIGVAILLKETLYTVKETDQVIITQLGKAVGEPITEAGLHFKTPFIQKANFIEKRFLAWDGRPTEMPTKEKTYIIVDTFARWRISDPLRFFEKLRDLRSAQSRLDDILGSETRNAVASHELIEVIRTTKDRQPAKDESLLPPPPVEGEDAVLPVTPLPMVVTEVGELKPIRKGRAKVEEEIFTNAEGKLKEFGIQLLDIRFKRINYNPKVQMRIYARMISERQQIAERFRSEGAGEAAKILGKKERDLKEIASAAYKKIQNVEGDADAEATEIYASAYNQSPEAAEFYRFLKSMETYKAILGQDTTLVLSTDSDLFRFLKDMQGGLAPAASSTPAAKPAPALPSAPRRPVPLPSPAAVPAGQ